MSSDRERVVQELVEAGVAGAEEFGRFVNDARHLTPSAFDEQAAMPVLVGVLPSLTDPRVVSAVAGHLRRTWARPVAFDALLAAYTLWAPQDELGAGWQLADALAVASDATQVGELLTLAADGRYGRSRQMLLDALWRFRSDERVAPVLARLCADPTVALHAMAAYRRTVGNEAALPLLRELVSSDDALVRQQATRQLKKAEQALSS